MYCNKCGKLIHDESVYCNYCGNKIEVLKNEEIDNKTINTKIESENFNVQEVKNSFETIKETKVKQSRAISGVYSKRPISIIALIAISVFFVLILIPFFIYHTLTSLFLAIWGVSTVFTIILFTLVFSNIQPRKKWFKIFTSIAFGISIISFILALSFSIGSYDTDNISKTKPTILTEPTAVETTSFISTEKIAEITTTTQESLKKFSFDKYITVKTRECDIVQEENISIKALGDKLPSEYTQAEIDKLPINFRMKYSVVVPRDITEEELKSTMAYVMKTMSNENLDIDEIYVATWYDLESVGKGICIAWAEWCPEGRWAQMPPEIAQNNIRDSYLINFNFNAPIEQEESKYGLTEQQRKQTFYDMVVLEDKISINDPNYDEKMDNVEATIAQKYGITIEQVRAIGIEGVTKGWPMPPIE